MSWCSLASPQKHMEYLQPPPNMHHVLMHAGTSVMEPVLFVLCCSKCECMVAFVFELHIEMFQALSEFQGSARQ